MFICFAAFVLCFASFTLEIFTYPRPAGTGAAKWIVYVFSFRICAFPQKRICSICLWISIKISSFAELWVPSKFLSLTAIVGAQRIWIRRLVPIAVILSIVWRLVPICVVLCIFTIWIAWIILRVVLIRTVVIPLHKEKDPYKYKCFKESLLTYAVYLHYYYCYYYYFYNCFYCYISCK